MYKASDWKLKTVKHVSPCPPPPIYEGFVLFYQETPDVFTAECGWKTQNELVHFAYYWSGAFNPLLQILER